MIRILVVCQHYWPESFQIVDICEELVNRGHEVTVLAGLPNYPSGVIPEDYRGGKNREQVHNGVRIIRASEIARGKGTVRLALNYYSFSNSAVRIARHLTEEYDIVFAYQLSPVMMARPAAELKQLKGIPMLLYCCDLWPESMKVMLGDKLPSVIRHYGKVSKRIYDSADLIAVQSPSFKDYFREVHGIKKEKLRYIPQFSTDGANGVIPTAEHEDVVFLTAGNIGRAQDMPVVLQAIDKMSSKTGFQYHIVGDGSCLEESRAFVESHGLDDRVVFHGRVPVEEMQSWYSKADACIIALNGDTWVGTTLPARLQGYMAAGKTVFGAINGGAQKVIEMSGCGGAVPAGDIEGLARLLDGYLDDPSLFAHCGKAGRNYFETNFSKTSYVDTIEQTFVELIGKDINV